MQFKQFALKWVEIIFDGVYSFVCSRVGSIHCLMNRIRTCRVPLGTNETRGHWMVWAHYLQTANPLHNHNDVLRMSVRSFLIFIPLYFQTIPMDCIDLKLRTFQIWTKVTIFSKSLLAACMLSKLTLPCLTSSIQQQYDNTELYMGVRPWHVFNC